MNNNQKYKYKKYEYECIIQSIRRSSKTAGAQLQVMDIYLKLGLYPKILVDC